MTSARQLRTLLARPDLVVAPGVFDGITARLVQQAGYPCAYMTGAGTALSLGFPDYGLLTMTEMAANATVVARTAGIPVVADADTGYGNELNVTRTVQEYARAGVAGAHIEDQVAPKRCGHLEGKELVPTEEFVAKIRAALAARPDPDFVIIARTDARAVTGLDDAIARANAALAAGADMAFLDAIPSLDELAAVTRRVRGPCLFNVVRGGKTPDVPVADIQAMGYRLAIVPSLLLSTVFEACDAALARLRETGLPLASGGGPAMTERFQRMDAAEWDAMRTRFRITDRAEAAE